MDKVSLDVGERILFFTVASHFLSNFLWLIGLGYYYWFVLLSTASVVAVLALDRILVNPKGKAVLISGCDTGFGNETSKVLHKKGYHVLAGVLFEDGPGALQLKKLGIDVFHMDVTKDISMTYVEERLKAKSTQLWAIITNAGLSTFGEVEWVPIDVHEKIFSVNVIGTVRLAKAALPLLRQCGGRVITVASMLGRFGAPSRSPYSLSKWAVEGFSECLRLEMRRWGVKVIVIEPGNFVAATALYEGDAIKRQSDYMWSNMSEQVQLDYGRDYFDRQIETMTFYSKHGNKDTGPVIGTMVDAVSHTFPQTRYQVMSLGEKVKCFVSTHLPSIVFFIYSWSTPHICR
ncbi:unnamed protein product [Allacma fusca]|uniref:D-beta-hydroxybutyrate dehydrogenase, mitochondrial n=1 Tax=Allacma fusca TaxID=39272 RepID=A0A8J2LR31_9HEXA|nr:unnamed protein product [Allacma fusca]